MVEMNQTVTISISIVSHGQAAMVRSLIQSLQKVEELDRTEIIITENLPTDSTSYEYSDSNMIQINNQVPKGFAENQNEAFKHATGAYFCIINPDVIFIEPVFQSLIENVENKRGDILAPLVVNSMDEIQDSFRPLPTPLSLLNRLVGSKRPVSHPPLEGPIYPDWLAGIFLFMRREIFSNLNGMDERYKLYFEDVDFSSRARIAGYKIMFDPSRKIVHDAQRSSHRDPYLALKHLSSGVRFFRSDVYKQVRELPDQ